MSNVSNRHTVQLFEAGKSEALTGQRLAKVGYKSGKNAPAKFPSICVSVPVVDTDDVKGNINRLMPYIKEMVSNAQDGIIRSLYESSQGALSNVSDDDISVNSVINFLEAEQSGGRLTKEFLENWFDSQVKTNLTVVIADKLGFDLSTTEQEEICEKHVKVYRDLISSLSGGKTVLTHVQMNGVERALEVSSVDDEVKDKLINRIKKMKEQPKMEDLLEL